MTELQIESGKSGSVPSGRFHFRFWRCNLLMQLHYFIPPSKKKKKWRQQKSFTKQADTSTIAFQLDITNYPVKFRKT